MNAGYLDINNIEKLGKEYAICVGTFDGVHRGHEELVNRAKSLGLKLAVLLIFSIDSVMKKHSKEGLLMSIADRTEVFTELGASALIYVDLDEKMRALSPQEFIDKVEKVIIEKENNKGEIVRLAKIFEDGKIRVKPVIEIDIKMRGLTMKFETIISTQKEMIFPLLIGRKELKGFLIDPSKTFVR